MKKLLQKLGLVVVALTLLVACKSPDSKQEETSKMSGEAPQKVYNWKMASSFPKGYPILGEAGDYYAELVRKLSNGRINIKVYAAGELVPAFEVFDAVSKGTIEMGNSAAYYSAGKIPEAVFFSVVPFGMTAWEVHAWLREGEGGKFWRDTYAKYNVVPFFGANASYQMGGIFNKEIKTMGDLKGLKIRIPGLGAEVYKKLGASPMNLPGGELYTAMERGVIDAVEWVNPFLDYKLGLHKVAQYYYYPGWQEPSTMLEFTINKELYESLPEDLQQILYTAGIEVYAISFAWSKDRNPGALQKMFAESKIELKKFSKEVLDGFRKASEEILDDIAKKNENATKIYESYKNYKKKVTKGSSILEASYFKDVYQSDFSK